MNGSDDVAMLWSDLQRSLGSVLDHRRFRLRGSGQDVSDVETASSRKLFTDTDTSAASGTSNEGTGTAGTGTILTQGIDGQLWDRPLRDRGAPQIQISFASQGFWHK